MVTCNCKLLKFNFGTLSPRFSPIRNPRNAQHLPNPCLHRRHRHSPRNCLAFSSEWNHSSATRYSPNEVKRSEWKKEHRNRERREEEEEEDVDGNEEEKKRKVHCEVDVVSWRERRIRAETFVHADVESVWNSLTDYERLADFVPNLVSSGRIPCPYPGRIWLEQKGCQRALYWHIEARVVLDLQEFVNSDYDRELHFSMVDGDFKKFEGKWCVKCGTRSSTAILSYEVNVIPRFNFPAIFLERIIRSDLPVNLRALACRSERNFGGNEDVAMTQNSLDRTSKAVSRTFERDGNVALNGKFNLSPTEFKNGFSVSNFGPMTPSSSKSNGKLGILGKICSLDKHCMVDEVHLRRFDGLLENGGVHRFVVASITVKAPVREVWNVLTDYESLPDSSTFLI